MTRSLKSKVYPPPWSAGMALDAVERWAFGCILLRETGALRNGRMDGLLIRTHFESVIAKNGLFAVEVKLSRADFQKGLTTGQYDRYLKDTNGLYLVTGVEVCKTAEVPRGMGHLIVSHRGDELQCICRRHATFHTREPLRESLLWRILVDCGDQFLKREQKMRWQTTKVVEQIKAVAGRKIAAMVEAA